MEWKDCSTGDKNRTPSVSILQTQVKSFWITVHRYHGCDPEAWFLTCSPFYDKYPLENTDIDEAKQEALTLVYGNIVTIFNDLSNFSLDKTGQE